jgi:hypothetical protein
VFIHSDCYAILHTGVIIRISNADTAFKTQRVLLSRLPSRETIWVNTDARCWIENCLCVRTVCFNINIIFGLDQSEPVKACNEIALPLQYLHMLK